MYRLTAGRCVVRNSANVMHRIHTHPANQSRHPKLVAYDSVYVACVPVHLLLDAAAAAAAVESCQPENTLLYPLYIQENSLV